MKRDIYCIIVLEARSLKLRCAQGPGEGGLQPPCGPPCPRVCSSSLTTLPRVPPLPEPPSLSEHQPSALGPPSSGLTSAPETLFSNKVRFRCRVRGSHPRTCGAMALPQMPCSVCQHQSRVGLPPSLSWVEPCLLPKSWETISHTVPCLLPSPRVFLSM